MARTSRSRLVRSFASAWTRQSESANRREIKRCEEQVTAALRMMMRHRWGGAITLVLTSSMLCASAPSLFGQRVDSTGSRLKTDTPTTESGRPEADPTTEQPENSQPASGFKDWIEQRIRSLTSPKSERDRGITVEAGTVTPGSGIAAGVGYKHLNAFGPGFGYEVGGMVSFRRYQQYSAAIGLLNDRSSSVELDTADRRVGALFNDSSRKEPGSALYVEARYRDYPQRVYFGSGMTSLKANRADYSLSGVSVEGVWQRQFTHSIGVSLRGGLLDLDV